MVFLKNVAIIGAGGTIGKCIVTELLKSGAHSITALTRTTSTTSTTTLPSGVAVEKVDYEDQSTLVAALRGKQVLIITLAMTTPPEHQLKIVEAAAEAGVPYVIPNGWGLDSTHSSSDDVFLGPGQRAVQKRIEELGKSHWIEFVSGFWYEFSLAGGVDRYGFDFEKKEVTFFGEGTARINSTTWDQISRAVAAVLSLDEDSQSGVSLKDLRNKSVYISSFFVSQRDILDSVLRVTGDKEDDWTITKVDPQARFGGGLEEFGKGQFIGLIRSLFTRIFYVEEEGIASGAFQTRHVLSNEALGLPKEDLDERTRVAIEMSKDFKYL